MAERAIPKPYRIPRRRSKLRRGPIGIPPEQWRNPAYLDFLRQCPCEVCGRRPCDPAHGPVNGMSSKGPDAGAIPLCREHHEEMHDLNWPAFEILRGINREKAATKHWAAFLIWRK